ncbi:MAG: hypothetical protein Q9200_000362 [Gallowayella weberi]
MQAPVVVMNTQSGDRQTGRKAQLSNITAAKTVADIIRSCLGPNAMLKMLLDPMGGIALTNDGHAILREIEVAHPAAKNMIELSRTQDEEVGDGTTTVIILAGEILAQALPQLERNIHPVVIISAFKRALNDALSIVEKVSMPVNTNDDQAMYRLISSAIDTKYAARWSQMMCSIALKAVRTVSHDAGGGKKEVDIKRYAKVEKVPGGQIEDSRVLDGVMLNKDITHPKMRRKIENPRVILLDCPLEYKKGESQTNIEISKEEDWNRILQIEEEQVEIMTDAIIALKPDVVITEKGVSDLAQHFLVKHNITALRRVRKTDNNRIARATGATIVNRVEDLRESDVGSQCGLFEIEKIGDEYFTFITKCKGPKACTILLRGPSKDILNEIERNLQDAMFVARNVVFRPRLSPGGGATEMAVSVRLGQLAKEVEGVQQWPYKAVAEAMEVIPRTLVQNSGSSPIRILTKLRAKHAEGQHTWGIDGHNGTLVDMKQYGTWEPEAVKLQSIKTAIEAACLLLRDNDSDYFTGRGCCVMGKPRMIILIRHAQSEGNKNREIHQTVPDHRVKLTQDGWKQAEAAGLKLRSLLRPDDTLHFFTSPYRRTRETTEGILNALTSSDPAPSPFPRHTIKVYEEPRLREQDFGNFQPGSSEMARMWSERAEYGHFFYRIPNGESAADAYDRVSGFNDTLWRSFGDDDFASVCVLVTHGLMTRVFLMKWYHFSVEYFEDLRNVDHCEFVVMKRSQENQKYILQNELRTWSELRREREEQKEPESPIPVRKRWAGSQDSHEKEPRRRQGRRQNTVEMFADDAAPVELVEKTDVNRDIEKQSRGATAASTHRLIITQILLVRKRPNAACRQGQYSRLVDLTLLEKHLKKAEMGEALVPVLQVDVDLI